MGGSPPTSQGRTLKGRGQGNGSRSIPRTVLLWRRRGGFLLTWSQPLRWGGRTPPTQDLPILEILCSEATSSFTHFQAEMQRCLQGSPHPLEAGYGDRWVKKRPSFPSSREVLRITLLTSLCPARTYMLGTSGIEGSSRGYIVEIKVDTKGTSICPRDSLYPRHSFVNMPKIGLHTTISANSSDHRKE